MKGIFCAKCFSIHSLPRGDLQSVKCDCGKITGWWINGEKGIARFAADDPTDGYMVGWNNQYLQGVAQRLATTDAMARDLHAVATDCPGFHFDKSRKACWTIILTPGMSSDTAWATADELEEMKKAEERSRGNT